MSQQDNPESKLVDIPLLPLRNVVVYPHMVLPLFVGRGKSIRALEVAMANDKQILLVSQKHEKSDDPVEKDLHQLGTVATILQLLRLPDGTVKVLVEGAYRAEVLKLHNDQDYMRADISELLEGKLELQKEESLFSSLMTQFEQYAKISKKVPPEVQNSISSIEELIAFVKKHGRIIISESIWKDGEYEIEIYDDYRE
jgi:ATP-dependent Lon protease